MFVSSLVIVLSSENTQLIHSMIPLDNEPRFLFLFDHVLVQTLAWQTSIWACINCKNRVKSERNKLSPMGSSAGGCFSRRSSLSRMLPCNFSILSKRFSMENQGFFMIFPVSNRSNQTDSGNFHSLASCRGFCPASPAWLTFVPSTYRACLRAWNELPGVPEVHQCEQRTFSYFLCYSSKCLQD